MCKHGNICTHAVMRSCAGDRMHALMHTIHNAMHTNSIYYTWMHRNMFTRTHECTPTYANVYYNIRMNKNNACRHMHAHACRQTHTHTHTHTCASTRTHTHTHMQVCKYACTHTRTHIHACMYVCMYTCTHTYT